MKLLLHTCCAPCAIFPIKSAKADGYTEISGFFYNPNIHPAGEYSKRLENVKKYFEIENVDLIAPENKVEEYFSYVSEFDYPDKRCPKCWEMRIARAAEFAKVNGFDGFTTTLLESPYQDHEILKNICTAASRKSGIEFYYKDFRFGFKAAHEEAHRIGIYCQNYCGCVFSLVERLEIKKKKK